MSFDLEEFLIKLVITVALAGMLVVLVFTLYANHRRYRLCVDNGGTWVKVNCHTVEDEICTTSDFGGQNIVTTCMPTTSTVCDDVCRGASVEDTSAEP